MKTYAPSMKRLTAFGVDLLCLGLIQSLGGKLGGTLGGAFQSLVTRDSEIIMNAVNSGTQWGGMFWFFAGFVLNFGVLQGLTGSTIGKRFFQIQALQANGETLGIRMSLFRSTLYLYSILPLYMGVWVLLFHPRRQAIHDLILNTFVFQNEMKAQKVIYLPDREDRAA